ncbi:hypothetical protein NQ318_008243 [Aromia moschata]|uniref:Uncharacterized protein n=1 Tax=Aromia moschata TaxID=1265417 RepID=A0AAV8Y7I8_9CUCU|nr:hypothetical protein NQ318_008243 [Aromia moschata]
MYLRPKPGETEEDLLRLQKEFEKNKAENKIQPAATVVSSTNKDEKEDRNDISDLTKVDIEEQLANTFEAIPVILICKVSLRRNCRDQPRLCLNSIQEGDFLRPRDEMLP